MNRVSQTRGYKVVVSLNRILNNNLNNVREGNREKDEEGTGWEDVLPLQKVTKF